MPQRRGVKAVEGGGWEGWPSLHPMFLVPLSTPSRATKGAVNPATEQAGVAHPGCRLRQVLRWVCS